LKRTILISFLLLAYWAGSHAKLQEVDISLGFIPLDQCRLTCEEDQ